MNALRSKFHGKQSRKSLNNEKVITETTTSVNNNITATEAQGTRVILDGANSSTLPRDELLENSTLVGNNGPILASTGAIATGIPANATPIVSHSEFHNDIGREHIDRYNDKVVEVLPANTSHLGETISTTRTSTTTKVTEIPAPLVNEIPIPPPLPPVYFVEQRSAPVISFSSSITRSELPTEIIERPVVVHEKIRREEVEEIQPIVHVEREKTEIRQITQPLFDKEVRPVVITERTLPIEVLPTVEREFVEVVRNTDSSSQIFEPVVRQILEKAPIIQETEKWRVIEEVTPIIYRETIIPHVIRISKPIREVIVEAPIYVESTMTARDLSFEERSRWSTFFQPLPAESFIPSQSLYAQRSASFAPSIRSQSNTQSNSIPIPPPAPQNLNSNWTKESTTGPVVIEKKTTTTTSTHFDGDHLIDGTVNTTRAI